MIDSRIRPLDDARRAATAMNRIFLDYCLSLPATDACPARADFHPGAIQAAMGHLVIYERRAPDHFHIRLFGTRVVERVGYDATDTNLLDLVHYAQKERISTLFNRILDERLGHFSLVRDRFASGRIARVELLRLPFLDRSGQPNLIIAATHELETTGYADRTDRPVLIAEPLEGWLFRLADDG